MPKCADASRLRRGLCTVERLRRNALEGSGSLREEQRSLTGSLRARGRNAGKPPNGIPESSEPIGRYGPSL
jgi:hypothetical protein